MDKKTKYTKELLGPIVKDSTAIGQVLDKLNLKRTGGNYRNINKWIKYHKLSTSHFTGQLWSKGKKRKDHPSIERFSKKLEIPDSEVFCKNSSYSGGQKIINRLTRSGEREYRCENCGIDEWLSNPITLHLDHKNGDHTDNRKGNLQILCPNCHQQTKTWGSKNGKKR